mmetsp:Transcript_137135/g.333269  ORF Transcript_137135/g.333269 Transcript_137135/m.333269 type:complete len:87 (-) Transcript_137135:41-301(-)
MPAVNVWRVSLLFSNEASPSSFVLPGFGFGEQSEPAYVRHAQHLFQQAGLNYFAFSRLQVSAASHAGDVLSTVLPLLSLWWGRGGS